MGTHTKFTDSQSLQLEDKQSKQDFCTDDVRERFKDVFIHSDIFMFGDERVGRRRKFWLSLRSLINEACETSVLCRIY